MKLRTALLVTSYTLLVLFNLCIAADIRDTQEYDLEVVKCMETMAQQAEAETQRDNENLYKETMSLKSASGQAWSPSNVLGKLQSSDPVVAYAISSSMRTSEHLVEDCMRETHSTTEEAIYDSMKRMNMVSTLRAFPSRATPNAAVPLPLTSGFCPYPTNYDCSDFLHFRSIDGSCNNLRNPILGRSNTPFRRMGPTRYNDRKQSPRQSVKGGELPGAREVSARAFPDFDRPSSQTSLLFVFFGQFLCHDSALTQITVVNKPDQTSSIEPVRCGRNGCNAKAGMGACMPIPVPSNDREFHGKQCIEFVRSMPANALDCAPGARQQLDTVTHWLDASNIYGSTMKDSIALRDNTNKNRGRLDTAKHPTANLKPLLPKSTVESDAPEACRASNFSSFCFAAGDTRVNENAGLATVHTVFMREHNEVEAELHKLNPHWSGEKLFQETRRIIIAYMQHIIYNEFLPVLMGRSEIKKFDLELKSFGFYNGYSPDIDGRFTTELATAAFRFGHSMIQQNIARNVGQARPEESLFVSQTFNKPDEVFNARKRGVDGLVEGISAQPSQIRENFITKQLTRSLFNEHPPHGLGLDLAAINIQRGRDHGIGTYNDFLEQCGFGRVTRFRDLSPLMSRTVRYGLYKTYKSVDDIDLFVGGLSELPLPGAVLGPTFSCIFGDSFRKLRKTDRFWYENQEQNNPFRPEQLDEIREITMSQILCRNGDNIQTMQPFAFLLPGSSTGFSQTEGAGKRNLPMDCSTISKIDLSAWKEENHYGAYPGR
jgi:peroxidase